VFPVRSLELCILCNRKKIKYIELDKKFSGTEKSEEKNPKDVSCILHTTADAKSQPGRTRSLGASRHSHCHSHFAARASAPVYAPLLRQNSPSTRKSSREFVVLCCRILILIVEFFLCRTSDADERLIDLTRES
jgi:hypothetical protein